MSQHKVILKNIFYTYPDGKKAINGISFEINHGESVAIVGSNGAGKSTLLLSMVGILSPDSGDIRIGDLAVIKKNFSTIRQKIGFTFQNADDQLFNATVYDDVAFGPRSYKLSEIEVKKRVERALEIVGASHLMERPPYKLSGGEKRSVSIASVLSMEPDILLMDEPSSALDPKSRRRLINLLKDFTHTKIIATHDLDLVLDVCERTIVLGNGQILADGSTQKILNDGELLDRCGLEKPFALQSCPICSKR
ncbi:cobalt/nickel transport system ATP-binding protein [Sedimentibacter acidaminivorans]|uniref:Cobalt/nickel transport system ATP-binding protein n=1 Tax=Sedimentibacter acidaminivorans TaxID=913099 RepID=A0ABS4GFX7_9FIRM|nr:energy-coupling factor ABC transporter ATP-binding protein [Sedimentibacter acidaminivorans]MBP1926584.1 cobalt/nickel transport system ATP-binding protein [Sedimentibacter acidaminivorans]